jgi:hypothetical protein
VVVNFLNYYDASTGRFLSVDPDPGKTDNPRTMLSKYIYAANQPTNFNDPNGKTFLYGNNWDPTAVQGNYCGATATGQPQNPYDPNSTVQGPPQDFLDSACAYHDQTYATSKDILSARQAPARIESDFNLIFTGLNYAFISGGGLNLLYNPVQAQEGLLVAAGGGLFLAAEVFIVPIDLIFGW